MNDITFFKQKIRNIRNKQTPSKRTIQTILDYSKTVQVKKMDNRKVFFFMNN